MNPFVFFLIASAVFVYGCQSGRMPADYVNPFIGASASTAHSYHGLGKTFPGAALPHGMAQVSPQTITGGDNGAGYSSEHGSIEGFSFTQMSGVGWYGDLGNLLVMPTTGSIKTFAGSDANPDAPTGWRSRYDKSSEQARAGYYSVMLTDYGIRVQASAAAHCGILRFTYPRHELSRLQIDFARRVGGTSVWQEIVVVDSITIAGSMRCTAQGGGWGNGDGNPDYTMYFYAQCSKPFYGKNGGSYGFWHADIPDSMPRRLENVTSAQYQTLIANADIIRNVREYKGKHTGFFVEFAAQQDEAVILKAGMSLSSVEHAKHNLNVEIPHWDFDRVRHQAYCAWNDALGRIKVEGGTMDDKTIFYTALYHAMIDPRYVHDAGSPERRVSIFSGWDVFRSQIPLQSIINPALVRDLIASLTTLAQQSGRGYYPRWEFLGAYSGCMIGNPAIAVVADALSKNISDFDHESAWQAAVNTSQRYGNYPLGYVPVQKGYSISETLEYAYSDWCMAQISKHLRKPPAIAAQYKRQAAAWRNIFDTEQAHWFRPRMADGSWAALPQEQDWMLKEWYGCIESNPLQQGWFVPHDIEGLTQLMGGREHALRMLETMFDSAPQDFRWNRYYNHANEPVHHAAYLFNLLGKPCLTQKWTRAICSRAYRSSAQGLTGNDDAGQMSAWYALSAAGIHPVCTGSGMYEITSPVFSRITFQLDPHYASGTAFTIIAHGNSPRSIYIERAALNGKPHGRHYITHAQIAAGGVLELWMSPKPCNSFSNNQ
jgi:predicted alpha-1,2-mannosidase